MSDRGHRGGRGGPRRGDGPRGASPAGRGFQSGGAPRGGAPRGGGGGGGGGGYGRGQGGGGGPPRGGGYRGGPGGGGGGGRGAPAEVFLEGVPAVPDPRLSDVNALVASFNKMQVTPEMPLRPGWGTAGRETKLRANFFALRLPVKQAIYDYDVKIRGKGDKSKGTGKGRGKGAAREKPKGEVDDGDEDDKLNGPRKARIFDLLESSPECAPHMDYIAHDRSARLVSSKVLPQPLVIPVRYVEEGDTVEQGEYTVEIRFTREFNTDEITPYLHGQDRRYDVAPLVSALNLVLQKHALKAGAVRVGQNKYFFPTTERHSLLAGLEARRGYFMSVRPTFKTLMVNVNASFAAFYDFSGNLAEMMFGIQRQTGTIPFQLFVKMKVVITHLRYRKTHTIFSVMGTSARQTRFNWNTKNKQVTVEDFFKEEHNITLRHADNLPVINVGTKSNPRYLPAEVCIVPPNQTFKNKLNPTATAAMIKVACNPPAVNATFITGEGLPLLGLSSTPNPGSALASFGMSVNEDMAVTPARILPPPRIEYRAGKSNVRDGGWNILGIQFQKGGNMANWGVLLVQEGRRGEFHGAGDAELKSFLLGFMDKCRSSGMTVPQTPPTIMVTPRLPQDRTQAMTSIRNTLTSNLKPGNKPSFVLVLLSGIDDYIYPGLKKLCDIDLGIHTVCMLLDKARKPKGQDQYFSNVALKVNAKLKGVNHTLDTTSLGWLKAKRTMYVGVDVTHPSPASAKGAPSIAAVVASADDTLAQFPVSLRLQTNRNINKDAEEMVQDLCDMLVERLTLYKKNVKALPERVIVYRDGVSEGQYKVLLEKELPRILEAFKKLQFKPTLSIIVCGKRHHARFPATTKGDTVANGNTLPGTVVDKGVTDVYNFDFYLQAHNGLQGNVRPTHYIVVYDENKLTADQVQTGIHNNSYLYARATKAVSLVPPAYYADLACERARLYLGPLLEGADARSVSSATRSRTDEEAERQRVFDRAQQMWGKGIHDDLKDSMFYI